MTKFEAFSVTEVVIKFDCSYHHFMALTENGCVYSWGYNRWGQLGDGSHTSFDKPKLINSLSEQFVTDISCGGRHSLVLTRSGDVLAFGANYNGECGTNNKDIQLIPINVIIANTTEKVIAISCGYWHSIALTESGHVFGWGWNSCGQLVPGVDICEVLVPIELNVPVIKQITCGQYYTLMLSNDGDIYFCGRISDHLSHSIPIKLNSSSVNFIEISATIQSELCVALSSDNKCFIFGKYGENNLHNDLRQTDFETINETFAYYEQITCVLRVETTLKYSNRFREIEIIGSGGFSTVFKCEHRLSQKLYAIKKVSFGVNSKEKVLKELKILSEISSSFVVKKFHSWIENNYYIELRDGDISELNQLLFSPLRTQLLHIQMELCSLTLRDAINRLVNDCHKTTTNTLSLIGYYISSELLYEILECVQYLHQQNPAIIHRDLKPENILLTNFDNNNNNHRFVKLSDFGLSTFHEFSEQSHTKYKGTKGYKAPELNFTTHYSTKVDVYSLGIIILELFQIDINGELIDKQLPLFAIKTMALNALNATPSLRHDCRQMLSHHSKWRLTSKQLSSNEEFIQIVLKKIKIKIIDLQLYRVLEL